MNTSQKLILAVGIVTFGIFVTYATMTNMTDTFKFWSVAVVIAAVVASLMFVFRRG